MACSPGASTVAQLQGADQNVRTGWRVKAAYETAGLTQRKLAALTDISQRPLSWIVSGASDRVRYDAQAAEGSQAPIMRDKLLQFADLNAYLDAQEI